MHGLYAEQQTVSELQIRFVKVVKTNLFLLKKNFEIDPNQT